MLNIFQESDLVLFMDSGIDKKPVGTFLTPVTKIVTEPLPYFAINPVSETNRNERGAGTHRASINVSAFRNFLFESDSLPLNVQLELLQHLHTRIPFAQVTFSGGSSYHAIISVADSLPFEPHTDEGIRLYSQAWRALNAELTEISSAFLGSACPSRLFDPACKDPARLSRTPNAIRPDNNQLQTSIPGFGGLIDSDKVMELMHKHKLENAPSAPRVAQCSTMDMQLLKLRLLYPENRGLRSKISKVFEWAASEHMYPEIFQLTLWLIDATGAPLNVATQFMAENVFPAIKAAGYPRNPEIAVHNAYIWKGLT